MQTGMFNVAFGHSLITEMLLMMSTDRSWLKICSLAAVCTWRIKPLFSLLCNSFQSADATVSKIKRCDHTCATFPEHFLVGERGLYCAMRWSLKCTKQTTDRLGGPDLLLISDLGRPQAPAYVLHEMLQQ
jgi:hypothetical protein